MRKATTHWLRHTAITDKIDAGMGLRYLQQDARHSDPRTTALYTHEDEERWHGEAQKNRLKSLSRP